MAILAVALHAVLWAAAPMAAGAAADPFSVICHSDGTSADQQTPASPAPPAAQPCDHCTLCGAVGPAAAALDSVLAGFLTPTTLMQGLYPAALARPDGIATDPNRTRGPPRQS